MNSYHYLLKKFPDLIINIQIVHKKDYIKNKGLSKNVSQKVVFISHLKFSYLIEHSFI
jgi:hypothetical protein